MLAGLVTSHGTMILAPIELASGRTRFSRASPWKVKATSAPWSWHALAIPQAIERSLATPIDEAFFTGHQLSSCGHAPVLAGEG